MSNDKNGRKNPVKTLVVVVILLICSFFGINLNDFIPEEVENSTIVSEDAVMYLTMIDVGQADSFLIVQDGKTALVDCGTRSTGEDVVEHLKNIGITKLDYVFGTHPHDDHMVVCMM